MKTLLFLCALFGLTCVANAQVVHTPLPENRVQHDKATNEGAIYANQLNAQIVALKAQVAQLQAELAAEKQKNAQLQAQIATATAKAVADLKTKIAALTLP